MSASIAAFAEMIANANNILIIAKQTASNDDVAAMLALREALVAKGKANTAVIPDIDFTLYPEAGIAGVVPALTRMRHFMLSVDLEKVELEGLSYEIKDKKLRVRLSPKEGAWSKADVQVGHSDWRFDLFITIGVDDLLDLGRTFGMYKEFFERTPRISLQGTPESILDLVELL